MSKVITRESPIHGTGVFAEDFIGPGWFIGTMSGQILSEPDWDCIHSAWFEDERGRSWSLKPDAPFKFLNHSDEPNAELDGPHVYALEKICPGEEITIHYGEGYDPADDEC